MRRTPRSGCAWPSYRRRRRVRAGGRRSPRAAWRPPLGSPVPPIGSRRTDARPPAVQGGDVHNVVTSVTKWSHPSQRGHIRHNVVTSVTTVIFHKMIIKNDIYIAP